MGGGVLKLFCGYNFGPPQFYTLHLSIDTKKDYPHQICMQTILSTSKSELIKSSPYREVTHTAHSMRIQFTLSISTLNVHIMEVS